MRPPWGNSNAQIGAGQLKVEDYVPASSSRQIRVGLSERSCVDVGLSLPRILAFLGLSKSSNEHQSAMTRVGRSEPRSVKSSRAGGRQLERLPAGARRAQAPRRVRLGEARETDYVRGGLVGRPQTHGGTRRLPVQARMRQPRARGAPRPTRTAAGTTAGRG